MTVYFVRAGRRGPIKIGVAVSYVARIRALQLASPVKLRLLRVIDGDYRTERCLHGMFRKHRLHGEWFRPVARLLQFIKSPEPLPEYMPRMKAYMKCTHAEAVRRGRRGGRATAKVRRVKLADQHKAVWHDKKYRTNDDAAMEISRMLRTPVTVQTLRRRFKASGRPGGWPLGMDKNGKAART